MPQIFSGSWLDSQSARTIHAWHSCAALALPQGSRYLRHEQHTREIPYDAAMHAIEREAKKAPCTKTERFAAQGRIVDAFARFAATALDLNEEAVQLITGDFLPAGTEFARSARRFDSNLTMAEIVQACRNAWTVCGLQPLLSERFEITPSIIGYSLLYPYTDNYLDSRDQSGEAKRRFCARFRLRLRGVRLPVRDHHEAAVWP